DNNILYWRKVVSHYFASSVKKRWCLSRYETQPCAPAPSSHPSMDAWQCEICRCKPATGYEAAFEVLPRIIKANFDSGVKSENLHFDNPLVYIHPSREKVFLFCKAVQETVYDRFRIMSWGFCVRRHEVFFSYGLIESQVNLLIQSTQNYQSAMMERGADGISPQVLSEYSNMLLTAGKCFQKGLNLNNYVDEFGFNTKIVRFLQMAEVLSSMEGLMVVSKFNDMGPIGCYEKLSPRMGNLRSSAASDPGLSSNREDSVEIGEEKIILTDLHEKLLDYSVESESPIMQESTLVANVNPGQSQSASGSGLSITSSNVTQTYGGR
ncbi:LIM-domain binding protein/SEUSS, partial [Dillenia turbinata]